MKDVFFVLISYFFCDCLNNLSSNYISGDCGAAKQGKLMQTI